MEELRELIELISKLPTLAVWVLVAFWIYKVIVIGSVYGLIKLFIIKFYGIFTTDRVVRQEFKLNDLYLTKGGKEALAEFLEVEINAYPSDLQVHRFIEAYRKMKNEKP